MGDNERMMINTRDTDTPTPRSFLETRINNRDTNFNLFDMAVPITQQPTLQTRPPQTVSPTVKDHHILSDVPSSSSTSHSSLSTSPLQTIPSRWNPDDSRFRGVTVHKFIGHTEVPFSLFDPCTNYSI